jgi:ligand-binding sensor domain-containing protein
VKWNRALLALVAALTSAAAADPGRAADPWHVDPVPEVRAICHAGDLLWVGTSAGLFALDIRNGALVDHVVAGPRLPSASVRAIAARHDSVFVGTDAGLACLVGGAATVWTPRAPGKLKSISLARIHNISFGANGDWLISSGGGGLGVVTARGAHAFTRRDSLLSDNVYGVMERRDGVRWIATTAGLCARMNDTTLVSFQAGAGIPRGEVRGIVGGDRTAYLLVAGRGVFRFDGMHAAAVASPRDIPLRDAVSLSYGADASLWAAGGNWVAVSRGGKWTKVAVPARDQQESWRVVVADGAGAFVGSSRGVVLAIGRGGTLRAELPGLLPSSQVGSICADGRDGAWFVSGGSVVHGDASTREVRVDQTGSAAQSLAVLRSGAVVSAGRWTVFRFEDGKWTDLRPDVPEADPAYTVARAGDHGELWVGTRAGSLYRYDGEVWLRVARADERVGDGAVLDAFVSAPGDVWGRIGATAAVAKSGYWERSAGIDSTMTIVDVARSPAGDWIAVTPRVLLRMDAQRRRWAPATPMEIVGGARKRDEPRGRLTAAAFDAAGSLFLGTTEGVARVTREGIVWMGPDLGLAGTEVSDLATDDHYLWIGFAQEGLSVVALDRVR